MVAYVFGTLGIFRLVRDALDFSSQRHHEPRRVAAWVAAIIYAANPNLIYLQATAMTEPLYLALFIWAVVYFSEFVQDCGESCEAQAANASSSLVKCGLCLAAACLTRYDAWFLAVAMCVIAMLVGADGEITRPGAPIASVRKFVLLAAAASGTLAGL